MFIDEYSDINEATKDLEKFANNISDNLSLVEISVVLDNVVIYKTTLLKKFDLYKEEQNGFIVKGVFDSIIMCYNQDNDFDKMTVVYNCKHKDGTVDKGTKTISKDVIPAFISDLRKNFNYL